MITMKDLPLAEVMRAHGNQGNFQSEIVSVHHPVAEFPGVPDRRPAAMGQPHWGSQVPQAAPAGLG